MCVTISIEQPPLWELGHLKGWLDEIFAQQTVMERRRQQCIPCGRQIIKMLIEQDLRWSNRLIHTAPIT